MPIDWFTVVAQILNFIVLVWILKRFLYTPILKTMGERQTRVRETIEDANTEKAKAQNERADLEKKQVKITHERAEILRQAECDATEERERLLTEARAEFDAARRHYQEALEREKEDFRSSFSKHARGEVIAIANRLLNDLADSDLQERMVRKFVNRFTDLNQEERDRMRAAVDDSHHRRSIVRSGFELDAHSREMLTGSVSALLGDASVQFEVEPSLGCGIELAVDGQKVAWSIEDYMRSLQSCVDDLLKRTEGVFTSSTEQPVDVAS